MRGSAFAICVAVAVILIARAIMFPVGPDDHAVTYNSLSKSSSTRDSLSDKEMLKPEVLHHDLTNRSQVERSLPDGLNEEFNQYHLQTVESFGRAMGFGRHRGGTHVLLDDGAVKFVTDSTDRTDSTEKRIDTKSPYGLWGSLGTRQSNDKIIEELPEEVIDEQKSVDDSEPAPQPILPPPPAIREPSKYHNGFDQLGFARFAPPSGPDSAYPFVLASIDLLSTEMELGYSLKDKEDTRFMMNSDTRELDPFEAKAILRLKTGSQNEYLQQGPQLQVVAAIRSSETCNECHRTNTGDLLGAFHYRLTLK